MPTKPVKKIDAWSWSRYYDYITCPFKAKCKHVDKLKEPGNEAMARGNNIHKDAEDYTKGLVTKLPESLKLFKKEFADLKKRKPSVERQDAFDKDWNYLGEGGWFSKLAWLRVKMDASYFNIKTRELVVIDHKTGKVREYGDQLGLYAAADAGIQIGIATIRPVIWYLDQGEIVDDVVYSIDDAKDLQKVWSKKTKPMLNDTRFAPKPHANCKYCHFRKDNGGPCKY
jgi:CRISPR/Cas system-associated exonuclease Cas4 (RecB family)